MSQRGHGKAVTCQVKGCGVLIDSSIKYNTKKRTCPSHLTADVVQLEEDPSNELFRFCHQCGKFECVDLFDDQKRSCRPSLSRRRTSEKRRRAYDKMVTPRHSRSYSSHYLEDDCMPDTAAAATGLNPSWATGWQLYQLHQLQQQQHEVQEIRALKRVRMETALPLLGAQHEQRARALKQRIWLLWQQEQQHRAAAAAAAAVAGMQQLGSCCHGVQACRPGSMCGHIMPPAAGIVAAAGTARAAAASPEVMGAHMESAWSCTASPAAVAPAAMAAAPKQQDLQEALLKKVQQAHMMQLCHLPMTCAVQQQQVSGQHLGHQSPQAQQQPGYQAQQQPGYQAAQQAEDWFVDLAKTYQQSSEGLPWIGEEVEAELQHYLQDELLLEEQVQYHQQQQRCTPERPAPDGSAEAQQAQPAAGSASSQLSGQLIAGQLVAGQLIDAMYEDALYQDAVAAAAAAGKEMAAAPSAHTASAFGSGGSAATAAAVVEPTAVTPRVPEAASVQRQQQHAVPAVPAASAGSEQQYPMQSGLLQQQHSMRGLVPVLPTDNIHNNTHQLLGFNNNYGSQQLLQMQQQVLATPFQQQAAKGVAPAAVRPNAAAAGVVARRTTSEGVSLNGDCIGMLQSQLMDLQSQVEQLQGMLASRVQSC